jgi:uncharacterized protein (TIGR00251 family)
MLFVEQLPIKILAEEILLYIKVTPNAAKTRIGKVFNNSLKIYVTAVAESGQANKVVIELLADRLKISKNKIIITHGLTEQHKTISLTGDKDHLIEYLKIMVSN